MKRFSSRLRSGLLALGVAAVCVIGLGCANKARSGALIGAIGGAAAGQAIGRDTEGTLIGTAAGAGAGYIVGNEMDKEDAKHEQFPPEEHDYPPEEYQ